MLDPSPRPPITGTVLNVNDTDASRYAVTYARRRAGFAVTEAASGQECLDHVGVSAPDLIVLDVQLPDLSGFEVCRRLKADPGTASIAVLRQFQDPADALTRLNGFVHDAHRLDPRAPRRSSS